MTQRVEVQTMSGATLAISASIPATYDAAGYGASGIVYTTIGKVENFGNHGVTSAVQQFIPIEDAVVYKVKGHKDYGNMSLMLGNVDSNAGQTIVLAASESNSHYSVKITYPLGDGEVTPVIHYLDVLVAKAEYQDGSVDDVRKIAVDLAVCRKPVVVAAT